MIPTKKDVCLVTSIFNSTFPEKMEVTHFCIFKYNNLLLILMFVLFIVLSDINRVNDNNNYNNVI